MRVTPCLSSMCVTAGQGVQLVQKKKTLYPEWNSCFDAHLYEGRAIQMIVMERPNKFLADITIGAKVMADKCNGSNNHVATVWVREKGCFMVKSVVLICLLTALVAVTLLNILYLSSFSTSLLSYSVKLVLFTILHVYVVWKGLKNFLKYQNLSFLHHPFLFLLFFLFFLSAFGPLPSSS